MLRAEYLFPLARWCSISPPREVDALTLTDFAIYTDAIDAYARALNPPT